MDHRKLAPALALLCGLGCSSLHWTMVKGFRAPGETNAGLPEDVWAEYKCDLRRRPFFRVEKTQVLPRRVRAGGDFGHRLVYVMCADEPTQVVEGQLSTRIRYRGKPIARDTDLDYAIKPGRWVMDALITLPTEAEPGVYAYEIEFESDAIAFEQRQTFVVESP